MMFSQLGRKPSRISRKRIERSYRPTLESLEERVVPSFVDGFEGPTLDPFWTVATRSGFITFPSTAQVHSGSQSVEFDTTQTADGKRVALSHTFSNPVYGVFSIWIYDTGANVPSGNYISLAVGNPAQGQGVDLGTYDYNTGDGGTYNGDFNGVSFHSGITRTEAWHRLEINATPSSTTCSVDGQVVATSASMSVTDVSFSLGGPSWRPAFVAHFDDFRFDQFGGDIKPTELAWDTTQGGVNFGYQVSGAALAQDTTAQLYWASGTTTDTILVPATTPIAIPQTSPLDQEQIVHLAPTDFPGGPPSGAKYLLAVVDPDNTIDEGTQGEENNIITQLYDPKLTVTAKYDGDPTDSGMGRYFSGATVLKDNYYTVTVSDSLDAFRPAIQVQVGDQTLDVTRSLTQPDTFVSAAFDPGSLAAGNIPLNGEALIQGNGVAGFSATLLVEPLPDWVNALGPTITFDADGAAPGAGAYVFDGFLPDLSLSGNVFTVPRKVPFIGGQTLNAQAGFEIRTIAPLSVSSTPSVEAGLQANLTLGDSISLPIFLLPPTVGQDGASWTLSVTPGSTLDPVTLNEANGFSLTVAFDAKAPTPLNATLFDSSLFVFPFGIPTELEFEVTAALNVTLHAHAQIALDSTNGLEFLSGGTYLGVGLEGDLSASARAGWFAPAWVRKLFDLNQGGHFKVPSFALKDDATVTLSVDAEAHFGGTLSKLRLSGLVFSGKGVFSDKLDLLFEIGDITVFDIVIADLRKKDPLFSWSITVP